jgi:hypothetical protein
MLQEGGFPGDLTVAQTGRMGAGTLTSSRPVSEALDLVDLRHRADVSVKQLSGGRSAVSTWPWPSSAAPRSCSWTSPPPGWTR